MYSRAAPLLAAILLGAAGPAAAMDRGMMHAYVVAMVVAFEAEQHCSGMAPNEIALMSLSYALNRTDRDEPAIEADIIATKPTIQLARLKAGAAEWCSASWAVFGPNGIGTIKRK